MQAPSSRYGGESGPSIQLARTFQRLPKQFVEARFARAMLDLLHELEAGHMEPQTADNLVTSLDRALTVRSTGPELSDEAQELVFEGEHLHHFGEEYGPDVARMRRLAGTILGREQRTDAIGIA